MVASAQPLPSPLQAGPATAQHNELSGAWLAECWQQGITAAIGERLHQLGLRAIVPGAAEDTAAMRAFVALAAMGHGDYDLADQALPAAPPEVAAPAVRLLDRAARLYRACGDAEKDPGRALAAMEDLEEARRQAAALDTPEAHAARGYAGLILGEALLMAGDIGAARHQLSLVVEEGRPPPAAAITARCILAGIEHAVGRADLAVGHIQAALRTAAGLPPEELLCRLLLIGVMISYNARYAVALFDEFLARQRGKGPRGHGAVARLFRLIELLVPALPEAPAVIGAGGAALTLPQRIELREVLRFLQGRHYSAGWFLLFTSLCAGMLGAAGDPSEAYSVLVHAAATLRCRRMDGAAELCDRQIEALRHHLGEERFEAVLTEARHRRQLVVGHGGLPDC